MDPSGAIRMGQTELKGLKVIIPTMGCFSSHGSKRGIEGACPETHGEGCPYPFTIEADSYCPSLILL